MFMVQRDNTEQRRDFTNNVFLSNLPIYEQPFLLGFRSHRATYELHRSGRLKQRSITQSFQELKSIARIGRFEGPIDFGPDLIQQAGSLVLVALGNPPVKLAKVPQQA